MAHNIVSLKTYAIFALALAEVSTWTIDLPDVRKYFFEKHENAELVEKKYDYKYEKEERPVYYSNIEGNSKHNTKNYDDVYANTAYAREYGYESYMEEKVNDIVYNGSIYLEGLRRALENYTQQLEDCGRVNTTNSTTWRPALESSQLNDSAASTRSRCREAGRASEHVRRLAALAVWAARELQDVAYAREYKKDDEHSLSMQENELILKLAWFLDRLAHYTGYEPEPKEFFDDTPEVTTSTTTPAPPSLMGASPELTRLMMECLKQNSSEAAADRCRYPEPLPPLVQMMMEMNSNITGIPAMPAASSSNQQQVLPMTRSDPVSEQSMELLIASDYRTPSSNLPSLTAKMTSDYSALTAVKNVQKRSILSMLGSKETKPNGLDTQNLKRSSEVTSSSLENNPAVNFVKYFAKHKVWEGANSKTLESNAFQRYEVKNNLEHKISKRAIENKKFKHLKTSENPFQDLSKYVKNKKGVSYVKDEFLTQEIKQALEKMASKPSSKNLYWQLAKKFRQKRSVTYEKDVDLPRESGDPQRDISYYTKNKPGRNYNNDLLQALQVRAGLQQVFNTGNIEVVRRYGANYNPLIPNPFLAGIIKSQADF